MHRKLRYLCLYAPSSRDGTGQATADMIVLVTVDMEFCKIVN